MISHTSVRDADRVMDSRGKRARAIRTWAMRVRFFRPLLVEPLEQRTLLAAQLLADINQMALAAPINGPITTVGSTAFFAANDGLHGPELWKSDGTPGGTSIVKDLLTDG